MDDPEGCVGCNPALHPAGQRQGRLSEAHVGVHLGDRGPEWLVSHDGHDVTDLCVEAMAGDPGWVLLHVPVAPGNHRDIEVHFGPDPHAALAVFAGSVRISRKPSERLAADDT